MNWILLQPYTISILFSSKWPEITTFNAMNVWQIGCYLTVFLSVSEFCLIIYLTRTAIWEEIIKNEKKVDTLNDKKSSKVLKNLLFTHRYVPSLIPKIFFQQKSDSNLKLAKNIEQMTRSILPTGYILFIVIYFITCFIAITNHHN